MKVNTHNDSVLLAKAIVTAARIAEEHYRYSSSHNYELQEKLLKAAASVGVVDADKETFTFKRKRREATK